MTDLSEDLEVDKIGEQVLDRAASVIKVLGHSLRLRLLEAMEDGERTVSELQEYSGASQSAVSQQLGVLRGYGIVDGRRRGSFVYYQIMEPKVGMILDCIRNCQFDV